jgi:hypothetical protein
MKHWLWGFSFLLIGLTTAQDSSSATSSNSPTCCDSPKPQKGDWSTEATFYAQTGSNSLRFGISDIKIRKFIASNTVARMRFIASQNNETTIIANSVGNMERSITEAAFAIAPGFEKHIGTYKKLSPYWGAEVLYGINTYEYNLTNSTNGQSFYNGGNFNTKTTGAYTYGANLLVGADYYLTKGIFIGLPTLILGVYMSSTMLLALCSRSRSEIIMRFMLVESALLLLRSISITLTALSNPDPRCANCQYAPQFSPYESP